MTPTVPLVIVIIASLAYHCAQKQAGGESPWRTLVVAYGVAVSMTVVAALRTDAVTRWQFTVRELGYGSLIGLAAFGMEAGYFFAYRSGARIAAAPTITSASIAIGAALVGLIVFDEPLTALRALGLALAVGGAALLAWA